MNAALPPRRTGAEPLRHPIYLDNHATTPTDPRVAKLVYDVMTERFGNPNSADHIFGEAAASLMDVAVGEVSALLGCPDEWVTFTGGSSHGLRLALAHAQGGHRHDPLKVAMSRVEHRALIDAAEDLMRHGQVSVRWIEVDELGRLRPESLAGALADADLLCVMAANNEVGTLFPLNQIAAKAREAGVALLVDASQAAGRVPLDAQGIGADYLVMTAHKIYGPKGVGALISPIVDKRDLRGLPYAWEGTPNVPGIAGLGEACRLRRLEMAADHQRISRLRDRLEARLLQSVPGLAINGDRERRLAENLHISAPGAPNDLVTMALRRKVAISTGAACTSGAHGPSHVLQAMGLPADLQESALRIGVGKFNSESEIDAAAVAIAEAIAQVRAEQEAFA
jgi:cysteine desulfurase